MTPAEHYDMAERLLESCEAPTPDDGDPTPLYPEQEDGVNTILNALAAAQVHATLALAGARIATAEAGDRS